MSFLFFTDKQQVIGSAQVFGLFADVKVIPQILSIALVIHCIDLIVKQFTDTVGGDLVQDFDTTRTEQIPTGVDGMKYKGEIITAECFFVVVPVYKIVRYLVEHSEYDHVIGNKRKEQFAIGFAHTLCLGNGPELVRFAV